VNSTSTGTLPPDNRPEPPERGDERATLEGFLELQRATVVYKATGLSDSDAARRLVPSLTTVSGLIRHLADVERSWFREVMDGESNLSYRWTEEDPDGEFRVTDADTLDDIIADYESAIAESRAVQQKYSFDDVCHGRESRFTLRWITVHLIEETARHIGHIDILRDMLDGATGE
jgi:uncharacterized damage-inducible protein DinB